MLRIEMDLMKQFFQPTLDKIQQHIRAVFAEPDIGNITHLFLVGGFAESTLLQVSSWTLFRCLVIIQSHRLGYFLLL